MDSPPRNRRIDTLQDRRSFAIVLVARPQAVLAVQQHNRCTAGLKSCDVVPTLCFGVLLLHLRVVVGDPLLQLDAKSCTLLVCEALEETFNKVAVDHHVQPLGWIGRALLVVFKKNGAELVTDHCARNHRCPA